MPEILFLVKICQPCPTDLMDCIWSDDIFLDIFRSETMLNRPFTQSTFICFCFVCFFGLGVRSAARSFTSFFTTFWCPITFGCSAKDSTCTRCSWWPSFPRTRSWNGSIWSAGRYLPPSQQLTPASGPPFPKKPTSKFIHDLPNKSHWHICSFALVFYENILKYRVGM